MAPRNCRPLAIVVALALVGVIVYSGALAVPYTGAGERFAVAHESTGAYETAVDGEDSLPVTSLSDLSAAERRAYEAAKEQPIATGTSGERVLSSVRVCNDALVFCDGYWTMPRPASADRSIVEEPDGERYLVQVGTEDSPGPNPNPLPFLVSVWKIVVFGPYALFLAYRSFPSRSGRVTNAAVGYGALMVAVALLSPYASLFTGEPLLGWDFLLFGILTPLSIVTPLLLAFEIWRECRWPKPKALTERVLAVVFALLSLFILLYAASALDWILRHFVWWIVGFIVFSTPLVLVSEVWRVWSGPGPSEVIDRVRGAVGAWF